jgi:hypothetical protein
MPTQWFANRFQVVQTGIQLAGFVLAAYLAWPTLKANEFLYPGPILLYLISASVLIAIGRLTYVTYLNVGKERTSDTNTKILAKGVRPGQKLPNPSRDFPTPDWLKPLTPIINKTYKSETVELDGKEFQRCEFQDVTFLWNGTKPPRFVDCRMTGRPEVSFSSHNPLVFGTLQIVRSLEAAAGGGKGKIEWTLFDGGAR